MAHFGEQMMLDLAIQATAQERGQCRIGREIGRGMHLVNGPGRLYIATLVGYWEIGALYGMCQLENKTQYQPFRYVHQYKPNGQLPPGQVQALHKEQPERKCNRVALEANNLMYSAPGVRRVVVMADLALEKFHVVFTKYPRQRRQCIQRKGIPLLIPVPGPKVFLRGPAVPGPEPVQYLRRGRVCWCTYGERYCASSSRYRDWHPADKSCCP